MRKFVRFVVEEHQAILGSKVVLRSARNQEPDFVWPDEENARHKFEQRERKSPTAVSDICDDCIAFDYLRYGQTRQPDKGFPLILTPKGRHLLLKLGLIREFVRDNSDWMNASVAFIVGVFAAATPFIIYLLSRGTTSK